MNPCHEALKIHPKKTSLYKRNKQYSINWGKSLLNDPAHSPNLTLYHEDFSYA
jgi:hypothetical protein